MDQEEAERETPPPEAPQDAHGDAPQQHTYTQILDLTHDPTGAAAATITSFAKPRHGTTSVSMEHSSHPPLPHDQAGDSEEEEEEEEVAMAPAAATYANNAGTTAVPATSLALSSASAFAINPHTPGKVVETGKEQTGRWTKHEHEAFLAGLRMYGKEWKKVAAKVKTRTVVQTRTHAQKYFQKLQKTQDGDGVSDFDDPSPAKVPKKHTAAVPTTATTTSKPTPSPPSALKSSASRRSSTSTFSAAQVISGLSQASAHHPPVEATSTVAPSGVGVASSSNTSLPYAAPTAASDHAPAPPAPSSTSSASHGFSTGGWAPMQIVAPDPQMSRNNFPEPSPAATGKRKLAEIAAARMLAGVALQRVDGGAATPPLPESSSSTTSGSANKFKEAPPPPLFRSNAPMSLQIVNPETLGVTHDKKRKIDGGSPVTPWDGQLEALVNEEKTKEEDETDDTSTKEAKTVSLLHPVCGPGTAFGRSPLHRAVCELDLSALALQLKDVANQSAGVLARLDQAGYAPLHTASALKLTRKEHSVAAVEMVRTLLGAGAEATTPDRHGNTPLHWAARAGDSAVAEVLLLRNTPLDSRNEDGETPLHWAMRAGGRALAVVSLLVDNGARIMNLSKKYKRPVDLAAMGFLDNDEGSIAALTQNNNGESKMSRELKKAYRESLNEIRSSRHNLFLRSIASRTLLLHHKECLEHVPKTESDWEAPDRVVSIMKRLSNEKKPEVKNHEIVVSSEFERANLDLLSRVHSTDYLHFVQNLSKDLEKQGTSGNKSDDGSDRGGESNHPTVVPFTPMVQRSMIKISESTVKSIENSDTAFSAGSLKAARRAAGAVQHAVDCVLVGRNRNSFCVVRPPGHHAGVSGLLSGGESCGFCIFNNVAAGALYAISDDRLLCERCAIVDIDVHHGNGTEEIVRKCSDPDKLFFFSIHLYDNDKKKRGSNQLQYKFYPGTGSEDDLAMNIVNVPIIPLWKEQAPSSAPSTRTHNTRQKAARGSDQDESPLGTPRGSSSRNSDGGSESGATSPKVSRGLNPGSGRVAYREAIQSRLLPALRAFNPDLILISAGFDAAKGDVGNARHERGGRERVGLDLEPEDYAWTTRKILEIADICCNGKVVSVLEGGYGRSVPISSPDKNGFPPLDRTIFSECAVRHLHALVDPYDVEKRFNPLS